MAEATKLDDGVQAVAEFRRETLLDHFHGVGRVILMSKANGSPRGRFGTGVGGHDHDHVAEVRLAPVVVGQGAVVHDLQQQVEDFRVRLLDFIEQQYAMWLLGDRLGQQAALVEADIARRRTDQARDGVTLHVLGHVETHQLDPHGLGQLPRRFGLADAGRPGEQERTDRLVRRLEASAGQLDRGGQRVDGCILTKHGQLEVALQVTQQLPIGGVDVFWRNPRDLRHDILDLRHVDAFHTLLYRLQALVGTRLVDHVDGLVRHVPVIDVARCQLGGCTQRLIGVLDAMVRFKAPLEPAQDANGVFYRRLGHIHFLEAARQGAVFFEDPAEFLERGRTDATDIARRQQRLEQVRRIHHATGSRTGTDDGVDFVNEQDRLRAFFQLAEQRLEALLEIATVLGPGEQCAQVKGVDDAVGQQVGHLVINNAFGQAFGNRGFTHACLTDQQRVVLAATRQDLRHALNFQLTPHQRIDPPLARQFVEVAGISVQRVARRRRLTALVILHILLTFRVIAMPRHLGNAMGDVVDDINTGNALLLEQEHSLAFLLAEDRHEHIGPCDFALAGALYVENGTLQYPLEAQGWLGLAVLVMNGDQRRGGVDKLLQVMLEFVEIGTTRTQYGGGSFVIQKCQQQVFDGHEFMTLRTGLLEGKIEGDFELAV
eukprot:gene16379-biopygen8373